MSRGLAWDMGAWPISGSFFFKSEMTCSEKFDTELGQAPTYQATPRDVHHLRTALKLGSEDSQLSGAYALQIWW